MYTPTHYNETDESKIKDFIRTNDFGILINTIDNHLTATHLPFNLITLSGKRILQTHLAKANPQWKNLESSSEVLIIFNGPHTYISSWYKNKVSVPTWNYMAVHVYGTVRIQTEEELKNTLQSSLMIYEKNLDQFNQLPPHFLESMLRAIIGIEITIEKWEAKYKLSQNKTEEDRKNIIHQLEKKSDENAKKIAEEMKKYLKN